MLTWKAVMVCCIVAILIWLGLGREYVRNRRQHVEGTAWLMVASCIICLDAVWKDGFGGCYDILPLLFVDIVLAICLFLYVHFMDEEGADDCTDTEMRG